MNEELQSLARKAPEAAEQARSAAEELRITSDVTQKAAYDQTLIMQELRDTIVRYPDAPED